jgi:hypothetical protein
MEHSINEISKKKDLIEKGRGIKQIFEAYAKRGRRKKEKEKASCPEQGARSLCNITQHQPHSLTADDSH